MSGMTLMRKATETLLCFGIVRGPSGDRASEPAGVARGGGQRRESLDEERIDVAGIDYVTISVGDLGRSVRFYQRLFGCQVVERNYAGKARVLLSAGGAYVAMQERRAEPAEADTPPGRWSFMVEDIDRARACAWNLGVATVGGTDAPRRIHAWRRERSFMIRDPDGNEVEIVERRRQTRSTWF
ncbi:MAG: VOC family protein [Gammaproteobacteria bacterium]|nr:VOC family protein [Gammaproteobacteria bacterium]